MDSYANNRNRGTGARFWCSEDAIVSHRPATVDEIKITIRFRDPHSSKSMFSLPLGGR